MKTIYTINFYEDNDPYGYYDNIADVKETMFAIVQWTKKDLNTEEFNYIKNPNDIDINEEYFGFFVEKIFITNKLICDGFEGMNKKYFIEK